MKIFCDTNILMEYIQQRKLVQEVEQVLSFAEKNGHLLYISFGSFYTITYLVERYLKDETLDKEARVEKLRTILTIDVKHFGKLSESGAIEVIDPQAFIEKYLCKL